MDVKKLVIGGRYRYSRGFGRSDDVELTEVEHEEFHGIPIPWKKRYNFQIVGTNTYYSLVKEQIERSIIEVPQEQPK